MFIRFFIFTFCLFFSFSSFAVVIPLGTDKAEAEIRRAENYFNNIGGFRSDFVQKNSDGSLSRGKLYFGSGGRMRFEYLPPDPYLLLSTGSGFIYVDRDLEEVTRASLSEVPLGFLLSGSVVMRGEDHRVDRIEVDGGRMVMRLELFVADVSSVDLVFDVGNFGLVGWVMVMGGGDRVEVDLVNIERGVSLDRGLFRFDGEF